MDLLRKTTKTPPAEIKKPNDIELNFSAERTGIAQADISKLESGNANPSLRTLDRLATGMGKRVEIRFV